SSLNYIPTTFGGEPHNLMFLKTINFKVYTNFL
ncbi:TPA: hypothetical protein ACXD4I_002410, partial [Staphylococcus aureus]